MSSLIIGAIGRLRLRVRRVQVGTQSRLGRLGKDLSLITLTNAKIAVNYIQLR